MKSTLIALGFSAFAVAHTGLKSRLAQQTDIPPTASAPSCTCALPEGGAGAGLPGLGQGAYTGFTQGASLSNGLSVTTVPDTQILEQGAAECCACNTGSHSAAAAATKNRHFDILVDIVFNEVLTWAQVGNSTTSSSG